MEETLVENRIDDINENVMAREKIDGEYFFKITDVDDMRPFFMSIVSDSDHWMFISSNGGLTAGRKNNEYAFFPYYTDDKIMESAEITGSKSIFWINGTHLWEPFSIRQEGLYNTQRNLYKNKYGNKVIFEEINHDLNLSFRYQWNSSDQYGFVKKSRLINTGANAVSVKVLDGFQNIIPYGVEPDTQVRVSNLVDAYKRSQLVKDAGLGIYALSAIIVDKAEPSEALKANVAWSLGLQNVTYLLSSLQLKTFRKTAEVYEEDDVKAEKGAYFVSTTLELSATSEKRWMLIGNVNLDHSKIATLKKEIKENDDLYNVVNNDINSGTERLNKLNASSDGLQLTADKQGDSRHYSNTLFNIMRGGVFDDNYTVERWDFDAYLKNANKKVYAKAGDVLASLPETFSLQHLKALAHESDDKNFRRLCLEYMPLKFSRRHGDPSRPWNRFSINTRSEIDGSKILDYEGNWRDIFQNWEALAHAFPEFTESMIHKFLNATTFDGYNPYRITKGGFDWETIEPDDPWSYIGYWGDHQIIYLSKFLEFIETYKPGILESYFNTDAFVYANVPYKIKPYKELLKNPKDTIEFDDDLDHKIRIKRQELGADGALLRDENFFICKVNFIEKILATVLAKLSNFIPEAGIWMNTQRPEWNDANNALVGNGVSMVTLYYLRRFLVVFDNMIAKSQINSVEISEELLELFNSIFEAFKKHHHLLNDQLSDEDRKRVLDQVGQASSSFRENIYDQSFSGHKKSILIGDIRNFIVTTQRYLEHSIDANERQDHLYHAYNLMTVEDNNEISISHLDEMLEGQVAVLSSRYLSSAKALSVLDAMKASALFRDDQYSYLLYPNKDLPTFTQKNHIPKEKAEQSQLIQTLVQVGDRSLVLKDIHGNYHFNGNFNNANSLKEALGHLSSGKHRDLVEKESKLLLDMFEEVFNHKAFTGRSGTFFGYEGLGSIYWHMVSKLKLAVQECCLKAIEEKASAETVGRLLEHYYEIDAGIGAHKPPKLYGAFPTDPYSHTPLGRGAQQPGMTGQVKEDILSRIGELGIRITDGNICFKPSLLKKDELIIKPRIYMYYDVASDYKEIPLEVGSLAFTYCQVPIIYSLNNNETIKVTKQDGRTEQFKGLCLNSELSQSVFERLHKIEKIEVQLSESRLR